MSTQSIAHICLLDCFQCDNYSLPTNSNNIIVSRMGQLEEINNSQITQLKWALSQINKKCKHMPMNLKRKKKKKCTATNEFCKREKDGDLHTKKKSFISLADSSKLPPSLGFLFIAIKDTLTLCA